MKRNGLKRKCMAVILSAVLGAASWTGAVRAEELPYGEEESAGLAEEPPYGEEESVGLAEDAFLDAADGNASDTGAEPGLAGDAPEDGIGEILLDVEEVSGWADTEGGLAEDTPAEEAFFEEEVLTESETESQDASMEKEEEFSADDGGALQGFGDDILELVEETAEPDLELAAGAPVEGSSLFWTWEDGSLIISGTGAMPDYGDDPAPWSYVGSDAVSVVIQPGVTSVGSHAFEEFERLTSVTIPDTVTSLGEGAFLRCGSLKEISLPAGIREVPDGAFAECTSLSSFQGPGVAVIGEYAFQRTGFSQFTVGASVTEIKYLAFYDTRITSFSVEPGNPVYFASDGVLFSSGGSVLAAYPAGDPRTFYAVPAGVTGIEDGAFMFSQNLTEVSLGNVSWLGEAAFGSCASLKSVTIPDSVTDLYDFTFFNCPNLESAKLGAGMISTSYGIFKDCVRLTSVDFGPGLQEVDSEAFAGCVSLTSITLPANVTQIMDQALKDCTGLVSFRSEGLEWICYQAFKGDYALASVSLNEGLTKIESEAFAGCTSLTSLYLPSTVRQIDSNAFDPVTALTMANEKLIPYGQNAYKTVDFVTVSGTRNYGYAYEVLELVNKRRAAQGAAPLVMNEALLEDAMVRALETSVLFAHVRPDASYYFTIDRDIKGENIASGQDTAAKVMENWMNSEGHRANILNKNFTTVGIGCCRIDSVYYWVQCFGVGEDAASCPRPADREVASAVGVYTGSLDGFGLKLDTYTFEIRFEKEKVKVGGSIEASLYLINPGNGRKIKLDNTGLTWKSGNPSVAKVKAGKITGVAGGTAAISVSTPYGICRMSKKIKVNNPAGFNVKTQKSVVYNGKAQKLPVTVTYKGKKVSPNYYTVTYSSNKKAGIATVKVKGTGSYKKYSGQTTFQILPGRAALLSAKSGKKGQVAVKWKKDSQGSGYEIQYSAGKKFKKSVTTVVENAKTAKTRWKDLTSGKTYYVRVRTFRKAKGELLYGAWSRTAKVKVK